MATIRFPTASQQLEACAEILNHWFPHREDFTEALKKVEAINNEVQERTGCIIDVRRCSRPNYFSTILCGRKYGLEVHNIQLSLLSDLAKRRSLEIRQTTSSVIVPFDPRKHTVDYEEIREYTGYAEENALFVGDALDTFSLRFFFTEDDRKFLDDLDCRMMGE